jgi:hypothetical protein
MIIEVSIAEVLDKWSILQIKSEMISDCGKLLNVKKERDYLFQKILIIDGIINDDLSDELLKVNYNLWEVEDKIRDLENRNKFDDSFISLARSVYKLNDLRAEIKRKINLKYKSNFVEEKSYRIPSF